MLLKLKCRWDAHDVLIVQSSQENIELRKCFQGEFHKRMPIEDRQNRTKTKANRI
jgi:hypothetical protein